MAILVTELTVENFKCIKSSTFQLSAFTPLIGYNNSGKSTIVNALGWLLRRTVLGASEFNDVDFPVRVSGTIVGISAAVLANLTPRHRAAIEPHVKDETLKICRTQSAPGVRSTDIVMTVWDFDKDDWGPNPIGIDNAIGVILPEPIRVGAMEDAAEDAAKAKSSTTIGKLLAEFIEPVRGAHEANIATHLHEVQRLISHDGDARIAELISIETAISAKIEDLFPGIAARLHFGVPTFEELLKAGTLRLLEGADKSRDFTSYGHGTQRSVQMALIRHLADVKRQSSPESSTTLLLIDEPELYLHPHAIEQVRVALKLLSESGYQVVFSTHSAQLVNSQDAQYALLVRKDPVSGTYARRRLRDAIQQVVPDSIHQMEQLFALTNSSFFLFSERVLLAEGKTEKRLLPSLMLAIRGRTLAQDKVAIVAQSGVNDTKKSMAILNAMDVPCKAIVDLDYVLGGAIKHGFIEADDESILGLKGVFRRMAAQGLVVVNGLGLPINHGELTASHAYALAATDAEGVAYISDLHDKLLGSNIWLWKLGAIENHLGIIGKNERVWAAYQTDLEENGAEALQNDEFTHVRQALAWAVS